MPSTTEWPTFEGEWLILTPTDKEDAHDLAVCANDPTFAYFLDRPDAFTADAFRTFIQELLAAGSQPYTLRLKTTGEVVGCSSFMDLRPYDRMLEIGTTWIADAWRGTYVHPESKRLMLRHAFETMNCARVQLQCDALNVRSARALESIGAVREGVLRSFGMRADGRIRDTLVFSVLQGEWPKVRAGLEKRLSGLN